MSYKALLSSPSARKSIEILAAAIDSEVSHDAPEIRIVSNSLKKLLHDPTHGSLPQVSQEHIAAPYMLIGSSEPQVVI